MRGGLLSNETLGTKFQTQNPNPKIQQIPNSNRPNRPRVLGDKRDCQRGWALS
jgi:hypothetical protein